MRRWRIFDGFFDPEDFEDMLEGMYSIITDLAWWNMSFDPSLYKARRYDDIKQDGFKEPFTDVIINDDKAEVVIAVELPGVRKEDIKVNATEDRILIKAERGEKRYYKDLPLEVEVLPETAKAKFNNGILEVIARMKSERKSIKVE